MTFRSIAILAAALLCSGCVFGEPGRNFDHSQDMLPGDLAHFRARVPDESGGQFVDHTVAFPIFFLPLILSVEEAEADRVDEGFHYHFEDNSAFGLLLSYRSEIGKFDDAGRNLYWAQQRRLLLGLLASYTAEERRLGDGSRLETSSYRFLTGLYGLDREGDKAEHRLLWFLTFGDDLD